MTYTYRGTRHDLDEPWPDGPAAPPDFDTSLCGTFAGWKRHERAGTICEPCRIARNAYNLDWKRANKNKPPKPRGFHPELCGTESGYARHKRWKVPGCDACKTAHAAHRKAERQRINEGDK